MLDALTPVLEGLTFTGGMNPIPELLKSFISPNVLPENEPGPTKPMPPILPAPADIIVPLNELEFMTFPDKSLMLLVVTVNELGERRSPDNFAVLLEVSYVNV